MRETEILESPESSPEETKTETPKRVTISKEGDITSENVKSEGGYKLYA